MVRDHDVGEGKGSYSSIITSDYLSLVNPWRSVRLLLLYRWVVTNHDRDIVRTKAKISCWTTMRNVASFIWSYVENIILALS